MELNEDIRKDLHQIIDKVNDTHILQAVYTILQKEAENSSNAIVGYSLAGPISKATFLNSIETAEARISSGKFTTQEDLEREAANW